ncbi:MAG: endolytic transglycosylase MltG [Clostridia bacterium]|nr:endolytic transglycosylase MltG [Clostridia bacterium]
MRRWAWAGVLAAAALLLASTAAAALSLVAPADPESRDAVLVRIPEGASTGGIGRILAERHIVKNALAFRLAARLDGLAGRLQAGWYRLSPSMTTHEILERLARGDVATVRFTVPEGYTVAQVRSLLVREGFGDAKAVAAATTQRSRVAAWLPAGAEVKEPLEGYLFPDTYTVPYGSGADAAVRAMTRRFAEVWAPELAARSRALGMTVHQTVTLASIIELETKYPQDRPLVSAVFHNRLKLGMPLGSDVTVAYAVGKPAKELTRADFANPSPYNTYVHAGLPPGPICNPGLDAIRAALEPANVPYLYFVALPDGHLLYAKTHEEHLKNVRRARSMESR